MGCTNKRCPPLRAGYGRKSADATGMMEGDRAMQVWGCAGVDTSP